jgi:hypothetical protein
MMLDKELSSSMKTYRLCHKAVYTRDVATQLILTSHATDANIAAYRSIPSAERDTQHERQHPLRKVNAFQYRRRIALPPVYTHTQHERHSTQTASFLVGQCTSASSKDSSTISTQQARRSTQTTSSPIDQYNPTSSKDSSTTNVLARSSQFTTKLHFKSLPHLTSTTFTCEVSE